MNGVDICEVAATCKSLKYWYGGKGEVASLELAKRLQKENPSTWTASYYNKAIKDINGTQRVGDCSYLVCKAYGIGMISSYGIRDRYPKWNGTPKDGMILWRKGHVGIYENDHVHELKGIDYDYRFSNYIPSEWAEIHYDPAIDYDPIAYAKGWHKDSEGWWYAYGTSKGSYYANCIKEINGKPYAFNGRGYMIEGKFVCYTSPDGDIVRIEEAT